MAASWGVVKSLAEFCDPVVLVSEEYAEGIATWQAMHQGHSASFVAVAEPRWGVWANRNRIGRFISYLAWLRCAEKVAHRLHQEDPFDLSIHASMSTYWLPSPVWRLGVPSIWGPVGGAVTCPRALWSLLGVKGLLEEWFDATAVRMCALFPSTRRTWRKVTVPVVQNEETLARLPLALRHRAVVLNHVLFLDPPMPVDEPRLSRDVVYVSPLETRKGPSLAIRALAGTPGDVRMKVLGDGPELARLQRLAARLGVSDRVQFLGRVPREQVFGHLRGCAAALFTGLREEGGCSLAEAMLIGAPVIVLGHGGAGWIARTYGYSDRVSVVEPSDLSTTIEGLSKAILCYIQAESSQSGPTLNQQSARRDLGEVIERAMKTTI